MTFNIILRFLVKIYIYIFLTMEFDNESLAIVWSSLKAILSWKINMIIIYKLAIDLSTDK